MSNLREIMQRLQSSQSGAGDKEAAAGLPPDPLLRRHSQHYAERLAQCSEAMLGYELAWLGQHREALELCRLQPEMLEAAGGACQLQRMEQEFFLFEQALASELAQRGLSPRPQRHAVVANEHAWELTHPGIRQVWGI